MVSARFQALCWVLGAHLDNIVVHKFSKSPVEELWGGQ